MLNFKDKTLTITGGTGSFGTAVINRIVRTGIINEIKELRVFSRDEKKQDDMRIAFKEPKLKFYIGDVRNYSSINEALRNVDFVFHAAALKQVPSCEFYPMEAVRTNILGAENAINAALNNNVKRMIVLSTDKAVYPINAMGMSKAMMEKLMVAKSRFISNEETIFCATRYGNVMASRGSVIPLFIKQIKLGQPITITDPSMTRFLMSLDDSVDLVLHSFEHGKGGDIFVQKAPACTIEDLAKALIKIFNSKSEIKYIGIRHGEKKYESLVSSEEMAKAIDLGRYYRIPADNRELNYSKYFAEGESDAIKYTDYTSDNTERLDVDQVVDLLLKLDLVKEQIANA